MPWQSYHTVWGLLVLGWIGNYIVRMAFSPLLDPVMAEFGLTHAQGGCLFSVFFFASRDLWLLGCAGIAPIWTQWLIGTWGPALFAEIGVRELSRSAVYASLLGVAAPPGLLAIGALSDRLVRRGVARRTVFAGAIVAIAVLVSLVGVVVAARGPTWLLAVLVFATSFFVWGAWAPAYALTAELAPRPLRGVAFGLLNATSFLASLLAPSVTGWIKDWSGSFARGC